VQLFFIFRCAWRAHLSSTTTKTRNARWNAAFTRQDRQNSEYLPRKGGVPVVLPRGALHGPVASFLIAECASEC